MPKFTSHKFIFIINKIFDKLFNTRAAGMYMFLFAFFIGLATFIENDYGTSAAQKVIFKAWWFEALLFLFSMSILFNIKRFRMIQQKKWALLMFHLAIVIIVIGAGITRYYGFEGVMHIRENDKSNSFLSFNTFLKFKVSNGQNEYLFDEEVLFASLEANDWEESYLVEDDLINIKLKKFIPNPVQSLQTSLDGKPTLKIVVGGVNGREEYYITQGEIKRIRNMIYNFKDTEYPGAFNIKIVNGSISFKTDVKYSRMVMATQTKDTVDASQEYKPLLLRALHTNENDSFVFGAYNKKGKLQVESKDVKVKNESTVALLLEIDVNGIKKETYIYGNKGNEGRPKVLNFKDLSITSSYGAKEITVPFSIRLNEFILDKYPGTNSASSYASEVTLLDTRDGTKIDYRIFMNNILNYGGYRFFQSSFDRDEKGTYLSVNSDFWGTLISYIGYGLLTLGMILTLFSKNTRFHTIVKKISKIRAKSSTFIIAFLLTLSSAFGQKHNHNIKKHSVSLEHAKEFSELVVQDFKGRMKPVHTLTRELLRKLYRKESYNGLNPDQVIASMFADKTAWYGEKLIKLGKHKDIHRKLQISTEYASYKDFFDVKGGYKLRNEVRSVYAMNQKDRGTYEKELIKIDERLNILSMIFSGNLLKIIPVQNDANNTWISKHNHTHNENSSEAEKLSDRFFNAYSLALQKGIQSGNFSEANHLVQELKGYQLKNGGSVMPSQTKIKAEIFLNNFNIFNRLTGYYFLLGIGFLVFLFLSIFKPRLKLKRIYQILFGLVVICFAMHTLGLGLRWYISGRAPWSNGYESMIYIAWTSTLAGILFTRKSFGGLAATMVLAGTILFVSMLSFLDPEITPLVPVLKSYWLTIHVSLEAGSYGFLMLGAIIGLINLILMIFLKESNKERIKDIITEMSYISELTLTGGLFMVSVGTYLGGVWANESWGRYWGWDAKETWALVTILVYAFILHMRLIPKMKGLYSYNVATIFGLASVIMTYYGVNYYLSGLHSYATGDPVPIPQWVYIAVLITFLICFVAFFKKRKFKKYIS